MRHDEFTIGAEFWCSGRQWRCTDLGTRTVIAIRIDSVDVDSNVPALRRTLSRDEAAADGWFNGPPYAVVERVFDEDDQAGCALDPDPDAAAQREGLPDAGMTADAWDSPAAKAAQIARARALRDQACAGGLRFEAYLPSDLADWLLGHVEDGTFRDPSEAVFVMLGEYQELEPHHDLRQELLRRGIQAAIDDPRPGIPGEVAMEQLRLRMAAPRLPPAVWPKGER